MRMSSFLIGLLVALAGFGGGAWLGVSQQKKKCDRTVVELLTEAQRVQSEMAAKIDSLQNLPAKVDTVIEVVKEIEWKTDTLILTSKEILLNTDTIKADVRHLKELLTP